LLDHSAQTVSSPFLFWSEPLSFFEKADAGAGKTRRVGGVFSTERQDKDEETLIQKGLDYAEFENHGWFNDNHSKDTDGVIGFPDRKVQKFKKGETLPDGRTAPANCSWGEGYLLDTSRGNKIWELGLALQKAPGGRRLGFSVEGVVEARSADNRKIVTKAKVRNVAITHCPTGEDTRLDVLAKSITAAEQDLLKSLSMGAAAPGVNPSAAGEVAGEGAGKVLARQSLEGGEPSSVAESAAPEDDDKDRVTKSAAVSALRIKFGFDQETAERAFGAILNLKQLGLLGA
jgi:hypothetical protein